MVVEAGRLAKDAVWGTAWNSLSNKMKRWEPFSNILWDKVGRPVFYGLNLGIRRYITSGD